MEFYKEKENSYYSQSRADIIRLLEERQLNQVKILEVGASGGYTLLDLKKRSIGKFVAGVDLFELPGSEQKNPLIDEFIFGDIEKELVLPFENEYFDVILLPDVLEHLVDPWKILEKLEVYLKVGGIIICSLPNFREMGNLKKIFIRGDFGYTEDGILDKTHLRFFCRKNMLSLVETIPSLKLDSCVAAHSKKEEKSNRKLLDMLSFGSLTDFIALQYLVMFRKV